MRIKLQLDQETTAKPSSTDHESPGLRVDRQDSMSVWPKKSQCILRIHTPKPRLTLCHSIDWSRIRNAVHFARGNDLERNFPPFGANRHASECSSRGRVD